MIVLDASAVVEVLLERPRKEQLAERVAEAESLHAPHGLDLEVASALRGLVRGRRIHSDRAIDLLGDLARLPVERYPVAALMPRVWALRSNFTVYDAAYIALAEALDCPLVTCDVKLRRGHNATVEFFG